MWETIGLTAQLAAVSTAVLLLGTPLAWWLANSRYWVKEAVATVLRCIAGLERLEYGHFSLSAAEVWQDGFRFLPPHRRAVGYVFQEASLFPHLSVTANLRFGQKRAADRGIVFDEVVTLLGLSRLLGRVPARLSGGERQRVAIGRAPLSQPRLLLMDEPLSALDRISKDEILPYLERLYDALSIPVIYVRHDLAEVERLADHLVLLPAGRVVASGPVAEVLADPDLPLCCGPDAAVVIDGQVVAEDAVYGLSRVAGAGAEILVPGRSDRPGCRRRLRIQVGDVSLCRVTPEKTSILNVLSARIDGFTPDDGHQAGEYLRLGSAGDGARLIARISRKSKDTLGLAKGNAVFAQIKAVALVDSSGTEGRSSGLDVPPMESDVARFG